MGGGYGMYKKKNVIRALEFLAARHSDKIKLERATKESYKVKPIFGGDWSYPVAANHATINGHIVKGLAKKLEKWGVCTSEDFLERVK